MMPVNPSWKTRSMADIQHRGRWKAPSSTRRYQKGGRVQQLLHLLKPPVLRQAMDASRNRTNVLQCLRWEPGNLLMRRCSLRFFLAVDTFLRVYAVHFMGCVALGYHFGVRIPFGDCQESSFDRWVDQVWNSCGFSSGYSMWVFHTGKRCAPWSSSSTIWSTSSWSW